MMSVPDNVIDKTQTQCCEVQVLPTILLSPVVKKLDRAIHRINHYPADKYHENQLLSIAPFALSTE